MLAGARGVLLKTEPAEMILKAIGRVHAGDWVILENAGLYWHLVDLIWIFIFPLYYLILH